MVEPGLLPPPKMENAMNKFVVSVLLGASIVACGAEPGEHSRRKIQDSPSDDGVAKDRNASPSPTSPISKGTLPEPDLNAPAQPTSPSAPEKLADQPPKSLEQLIDKSGGAVFELSTSNTQGIAGRVTKVSGDCMPPLSLATTCRTDKVTTRVHLFEGDVSAVSVAGAVPEFSLAEGFAHPGFLGSIETDNDGRFAVGLPPGTYTVLAEFDGSLYLNSFEGGAGIQDPNAKPGDVRLVYTAIVVEAGKTAIFNIVNSENAVY